MSTTLEIPSHVPPDRVVDFDIYGSVQPGDDSQTFLLRVRDAAPDVFYTPRNGGHWVATRARDIERIQTEYEIFSHEVISIPRATVMPMFPLTLDPPRHQAYRRLINPAFTPRAVSGLADHARAVTQRLVDGIVPRGHCEFIEDFARKLPIEVFLNMVDLPTADAPELLAWTEIATRSPDIPTRHGAIKNMMDYLAGKIAARAEAPGDDLLSQMVHAKVEGRDITPAETMSVCMLLLFGGLDTVASMLGFVARFLALNPGHCAALVAEPGLIPQAVEELLRRHGIANTARLIKRDVELGGASLKADEVILAPNALVALDDRVVSDPLTVDFHRPPGAPMSTFGKGPHLCPGATLARREVRVFLEEWLPRIPVFGLAPDKPPVVEVGAVSGVTRLDLVW